VVKSRAKEFEREADGSRVNRLDAHFQANNSTVERIAQIKEQDPDKAAELMRLGLEAAAIRRSNRISLASVSIKFPILSRILKGMFLIVALPYCVPVSILTLPLKAVCAFIFTKIKDFAFRNSVRFVVNLVLWPLLMILYSVIAYLFLPWQWALPVTLALLPAPIVAHETWRLIRLVISDFKLLMNSNLRAKYAQIRDIVLK
jgi:hypothetical protein